MKTLSEALGFDERLDKIKKLVDKSEKSYRNGDLVCWTALLVLLALATLATVQFHKSSKPDGLTHYDRVQMDRLVSGIK